jgi:hypothetical protein
MTRPMLVAALIFAATLGSSPASAQPWNDRTILEFTDPVAIPGATLQPGRYVFRIADSDSARHVIRVFDEDESRLIATLQAIPMQRSDATNDIVVKFDPAERGQAPAMKGWFYPGQRYGHEFVYPDEEARRIAERTKTLVLSGETSGDDRSGTLHVIDPAGARADWKGNDALNREWAEWNRKRASASGNSAAMIQADFKGVRVKLDDLEERPTQYIGKQVSVDGEIERVLGPRIFKIDEPGWADLDGEFLVLMPARAAALVRSGDNVTVSGTVRQFVRAEVEREWGWLDLKPEVEIELARKPVIVAERIIGGDDQRTMMIRSAAEDKPVGTGGSAAGGTGTAGVGAAAAAPITDVSTVATGDDDMVGRTVRLENAQVTGVERGRGFFVGPRERQLFVLTQYSADDGHQTSVDVGQKVSVDGFVMQMPTGVAGTLDAAGAVNRHIYVYATDID